MCLCSRTQSDGGKYRYIQQSEEDSLPFNTLEEEDLLFLIACINRTILSILFVRLVAEDHMLDK